MKKKASQKPEPRLTWTKFPNIYRIITEIPSKTVRILLFTAFFLAFVAVLLASFDLYESAKEEREIQSQRDLVRKEIERWEDIVGHYKGYRDGYFYLSVLEYRLGSFDKSRFYLEKTLQIDPNFEKGREMEKILSTK